MCLSFSLKKHNHFCELCLFKGPHGCPHFLIKSHPRAVALETRELIQQRGWASSPCLDFGGRWGHSALLKGEFSARPAEKPPATVFLWFQDDGKWCCSSHSFWVKSRSQEEVETADASLASVESFEDILEMQMHSKCYSNEQTSSESLRQTNFPSGLFIECWWIFEGATRVVTDLEWETSLD